MPSIYRVVILRAALTALLSLVASFSISYVVVPLLGGKLEGAGLIMTLVLPVVIGFPASAVQFWQFETTRRLRDSLVKALTQLDDVNAKLVGSNMELLRERSHDPLTRLLTEDVFRERMLHQPGHPDIGQLVKLRVDGLAGLRKSHGGAAADTAIFAAAAAIRSTLRPVDFAGRIGDHDLAIFMPGSTPILASLAIGSISQAVSAVQLPFPGDGPRPMTLSVGGVECAPGFIIETALEVADAELERSSAQGGNCSHWGNLRGPNLSRNTR
ncbi:GGDEF domain-containing protein [Rhizobium sp. C4]|uniref:GGDEF domain-containing protein n=1 Tax=Rhizobium sp. C4 TaxID=1349800 RepID=UPI001E430720|nr:GGDEF domain-containing protein [Rhizobium sp. C4]MCD2172872.1 GGDEF domain-containing protein [Rhizobium sp. C4]